MMLCETQVSKSVCVRQAADLLSAQGQFFLVTIAENKPEEIISIMQQHALTGGVSADALLVPCT